MVQKLPKHIAIVMDGNGRWAQSRDLPRLEGHKAGVDAARSVVDFCLQKNIAYLSLFAFSSENWSRSSEEVSFLMELLLEGLRTEIQRLNEKNICVRFIGDRSALSEIFQKHMRQMEDLTKNNQRMTVILAINYGGKWDIFQASKKMAQAVKHNQLSMEQLDENIFSSYLQTYEWPEPDLLIRSSGEQRISNFFLWQLAYTELYFIDRLWPDFSYDDFSKALSAYSKRQRRYGNVLSGVEQQST